MATTVEPIRAESAEERIARPVHPWLRSLFFWPVLIHCALSFVPLYFLSSRTGDFFAWETGNSLSAAALGAGYAGACTMFLLTLPEKDWTSARGTVFAPITLLLSALVLAGVYADQLHFTEGPALARAFAWLWLASLAVFQVTCFLVYKVHNTGPKVADPRGPAPMRADVSIPTAIMGAVLWGLAFALWIAPEAVGDHWAWQLDPLDARMLGAWFFAFGAGAWQALWEHDLHRMRAGFLTDVTLSILSMAALGIYADDVRWGNALTWVYIVVLVGLLVAGLTGRYMALPEALEAERKAREEEPVRA
ncbi:hypothetical protein ABZ027_07015 [Streptomyces sp. NPDC006332]|uniref:hypothetical protein n=1 Tax=Streptomyces sp. NPDC006332 TaxID=3155456 RepID=UPI0033A9B6AE